jgi:membrane-bound lytic murein transglycosylase B
LVKRLNRNLARASLLVVFFAYVPTAAAVSIEAYPQLNDLIEELVTEHGMKRNDLVAWLEDADIKERVLELMSRPAERLPWFKYRKLFVTDASVRAGAAFMTLHYDTLQRAFDEYGVPPEIIVAIIGVETRFGKVTGSLRVLDSLTTLSMEYPSRSKFFFKELREYLLLVGEEQLDPLKTKGSYAGAIGIPQFMPSSYRHYAVDFNANGRRDLVSDVEDAIGSVGNYLARHKWRRGEPIVSPIDGAMADDVSELVTGKLKASVPVAVLQERGVLGKEINPDWNVGVVELEREDGPEFRVGFHNFYVITRYNRSHSYAMAVFDLADGISREFGNN